MGLDICPALHIIKVGNHKIDQNYHVAHKSGPPRSGNSEGVLLGLLSFTATVKPLANVIGNHIRSDSDKKIDQNIAHGAHLLPVARMERAAKLV